MKRLLIPALFAALAIGACNKAPAPAGSAAADPAKAKAEAAAFMAENAKKPGVLMLEDGVQYKIISSGPAGGISPKPDDRVKVMYEGTLTDGTVFDSSYERGVPAVFSPAGVVPGFSAALQKMKPGDVWMVWMSPEKGYGADGGGRMPPETVMQFKLELQDVLPQSALG